MQKRDLDLVLSRVPKDVLALLMDNPGELFLAGGAIRSILTGEPVSDFDLFGGDARNMKVMAEILTHKRGAKLHTSQNALTVLGPANQKPVQFITKWQFKTPAELLTEFDFTIAKAVVYYAPPAQLGSIGTDGFLILGENGGWVGYVDPAYYSDLAARRLVYSGGGTPGGSLLRAVKLLRRGYSIQVESLAKLLTYVEDERIAAIAPADAFHGKEAVYLRILREVDPLPAVLGRVA